MGKRTMVLRLTGKVDRVTSLISYYAANWGQMTLGEILKRHKRGEQFPTSFTTTKR